MTAHDDGKMSTEVQHELVEPKAVESSVDHRQQRQLSVAPRDEAYPASRLESRRAAVGNSTLGVDLLAYLEIPFVHMRLIATCLVAAALVGWLAILVWPRSYESEAKLLIRIGHESVGLDPTATTSQTLIMEKTQEEEVNSALEALSSRALAESVVNALGESTILDGVMPSQGGTTAPASQAAELFEDVADWAKSGLQSVLLSTGVRDGLSDHEMAIRSIQSSVLISAPKRSTVVSIHASAKTPEVAQAIAHTMTEEYLEHHLANSHTTGSQEFFQTQVHEAEKKLAALLEQRSRFLQDNRIVSVDANQGILTEQLSTIERDALAAKSQLDQAKAEMEDLQAKIAVTDDEVIATKEEVFDETWSGMRQLVYELELQERSLSAKYTDDYIPLQQVREQLDGSRAILAKIQSDRVNLSTTPNPVKLKLESDLQQLQTRVAGLQSVLQMRQQQEDAISARVNELHKLGETLTQMDRDIKLLESSLLVLGQKLEEARIIDQLLSENISSVNIMQPATFVERAASPNKKLLAATMLLLGLMGGVGLAFLREMNAPTLRTEAHVESHLAEPVIACLPQVAGLKSARNIDPEKLGPIREHCVDIVSEMLLAMQEHAGAIGGRSIGIVSLNSGGGGSSLAAALALTCAEDCGMRTTLIDADTHKRSVSTAFGLNGSPGLAELTAGEATHADCIQRKAGSPLELISCSSSHNERQLVCGPKNVQAALERFREDSDLVIVDLPSASRPEQAIPLARHLDYLLLVVESEKTLHTKAARLTRQLGGGTRILGAVLNKQREYVPATLRRIFVPRARA